MMKVLVVVATLCGLAGTAEAQNFDFWRNIQWAVDLDLSATYAGNLEDWDVDGAEKLHHVAGNIDLRGLGGKSWWALAAQLDVEVGFEIPGAFVYGMHFSPLGFAVRFGERSYLGVVGGVGFGHVTGRVPFAMEMPVDAFLGLDLGSWIRFEAMARAIYTPGCELREKGSETFTFADEAELRVGFAIGKREHDFGTAWSDGTYVGFFAKEQGGGRIIGIMVSLSGNGASVEREARGL
jgi:hypothetical protein